MYIICKEGHLVYFWIGSYIFLPEESVIFSSRKECLAYLMKNGATRERAVEVIRTMQRLPSTWISV